MKKRHGRPPHRAQANTKTTLTIKIHADIKNLMVDQADAFDLSLSEYLSMLVVRDWGGVDGV
jgi:hypothetical protein